MRLVDDIDFVFGAGGAMSDVFLQVADLIDAAVGCGIDLDDVERFLRVDRQAFAAFVARLAKFGELRIGAPLFAIEQFCDQPRRRRLASPRAP